MSNKKPNKLELDSFVLKIRTFGFLVHFQMKHQSIIRKLQIKTFDVLHKNETSPNVLQMARHAAQNIQILL